MNNENPENNEEFKAPDWVSSDQAEELKPMSHGQRIAITLTLIIVFPFCLWAGWFEFGRAEQGHWRAWVYTFEWPAIGALAIYLWRKLMRGESIKFHIPTPEDRGIFNDEKKDSN